MYWEANGFKNRLGLALATISRKSKPKIRIEDRKWMQGLTKTFDSAQGRNYKITPAQYDELVKECDKIRGDSLSVGLNSENSQGLVAKLKEITGRIIPAREGRINIDETRNHFDIIEITMKEGDTSRSQIRIPVKILEYTGRI